MRSFLRSGEVFVKNFVVMATDLNRTAMEEVGAVSALDSDEKFMNKRVTVVFDEDTASQSSCKGLIRPMPEHERKGDELQVHFLVYIYNGHEKIRPCKNTSQTPMTTN